MVPSQPVRYIRLEFAAPAHPCLTCAKATHNPTSKPARINQKIWTSNDAIRAGKFRAIQLPNHDTKGKINLTKACLDYYQTVRDKLSFKIRVLLPELG